MADIQLTTAGNNSFRGFASLANGGHVSVWSGVSADGTEDIFQQRSDANGQPVGPIEVVNTQTVGRQANAVVGQLANGGYVVAWSTQPPPTNGLRTHLQIFDANGVAVGSEIEIPNATNTTPGDIIGLRDGGFVLDYQDTSSEYLLSFSDTGQVLSQLRVGVSSSQATGTALANGKFVFFDSLAGSISQPDGATIEGQIYTVSGGVIAPQGGRFTVNTAAAKFGPRSPFHSQTALADGGFVVAWTATVSDQTDIYVRRFSASGAPLTNEISVNTPSPFFEFGSFVIPTADGGWFVAWNAGSALNPTDNAHGQRFDASGAKVGPEISLTESPALSQIIRGLTLASDGSMILGWSTGTAGAVKLYQTHFNMVDGGAGADTLMGAAGDIRDMIYGAAGSDTLSGLDGADVIYGGDGDDVISGGGGNDLLDGGAGTDVLYGMDGDDILVGGGGTSSAPDYYYGGAGNDTYYVASTLTSPLDLVFEGTLFAGSEAGVGDVDTIHSTGQFFWDYYSVGEILHIDNAIEGGAYLVGGKDVAAKTIYGSSGTDYISTYGGNARVDAGAGSDAISFSLYGLDESYRGSNTVVMKAGNGADYVYEFRSGVDHIDLTAFHFGITGQQVLDQAVNVDNPGTADDYCYFYLTNAGGVDNYIVFMGLLSSQLQASDFVT